MPHGGDHQCAGTENKAPGDQWEGLDAHALRQLTPTIWRACQCIRLCEPPKTGEAVKDMGRGREVGDGEKHAARDEKHQR